jgi:serine O-acetyltransferase
MVVARWRSLPEVIDTSPDRENLPDLEAEIISKLFDRIKSLEQQVRDLNDRLHPTNEGDVETSGIRDVAENDKAIEDFLYGAGI